MGMYTEILIKSDVKRDLSEDVVGVLNFLFNCGERPEALPLHPLFDTDRWWLIGSCSSYYHTPWASSKYDESYLFSRSDIKNYDDEINKFFDWVRPYLDGSPGDTCIGWSWYEEEESPKLVYL